MSTSFLWGLIALFLISFFGSGPVPMPLTVTILWLGQFKLPALVIITATVGSLLGWLALERSIKGWIEARPEIIQRVPATYRHFFMKNPGFWLFIFNALPLPLDFIRFLALISGYNRVKLAIILTVSRLIRNTILVLMGSLLAEHQLMLWAVMTAFLLLPLPFGRLLQSPAQPEPASLLRAEG